MRFGILGPLEVVDAGRPLSITAPKQRALLAILLLASGKTVTSDRLLHELWATGPPGGGCRTLRFHVSKLRDALHPARRPGEEGVLVTRPSGYAVLVKSGDLDSTRFERLVHEAHLDLMFDPAEASAKLEEALGLWRGPALVDFQGEPFARVEIRRLEELRLSALEDRIEADLAAGAEAEVIGELECLVVQHPYRERLWSQLILALYRSDRQAEALRSYQQLRARLGADLGIEPSREVAELEERILLQDPGLNEPGAIQPHGGQLRGYLLKRRVGEGALGIVWRASQPAVGRDVAIEVIKPPYSNQADFIRRFEAEAKLAACLEHPNIVPVFDFWRDPKGAYLVTRLMGGGSLLGVEDWELSRVMKVARQVGGALAYAHRRGVFHGSLHPGNVLLDGDGNACLTGFGLTAGLELPKTAQPAEYMSPEQRDGREPGSAADIYALARLVFHLLSAEDPRIERVESIRRLRDDIPVEVDDVLTKATRSDPAERFDTVDEFLDALQSAAASLSH